jgi:hypothetical protein
MSPEARERIRQAQLKRWAKVKTANEGTATPVRGRRRSAAADHARKPPATRQPGRPKGSGREKRGFSPETRERMRQAQLRRWAKQKEATSK